ncbi:MAG: hypothetical protein ACRDD1_02830, partial [Planctomycetia bacterium]
KDRATVGLLKRNLGLARFADAADVRMGDAHVWAKYFVPDQRPTIVFLGPPYPLFTDDRDAMLAMIEGVQDRLKTTDHLVVQYPRFVEPETLPNQDGWVRMRHYGKTRVGIWQDAFAQGDPKSPWIRDEDDEPSDEEDPREEDGDEEDLIDAEYDESDDEVDDHADDPEGAADAHDDETDPDPADAR